MRLFCTYPEFWELVWWGRTQHLNIDTNSVYLHHKNHTSFCNIHSKRHILHGKDNQTLYDLNSWINSFFSFHPPQITKSLSRPLYNALIKCLSSNSALQSYLLRSYASTEIAVISLVSPFISVFHAYVYRENNPDEGEHKQTFGPLSNIYLQI